MNHEEQVQLSKFASLILRHKPEKFGVSLDYDGYCFVDDLLKAFQREPRWANVTKEDILLMVEQCPKQRYELNNDYIRARYGHSNGASPFKESTPPSYLFHGTNENALKLINQTGIKKMQRDYVHLSETTDFASLAGARRGKLVLLKVDTIEAAKQGVKFSYRGNEVWLSTDIPVGCFSKQEQ